MGWPQKSAGLLSTCLAAFGEAVVYTPAGGAALEISAVFDEDYIAVDPNTGAAVSSATPTLGIRLADLASAPKKGDVAMLRGRTFKVVNWQPDSEGSGLAVLHEQ